MFYNLSSNGPRENKHVGSLKKFKIHTNTSSLQTEEFAVTVNNSRRVFAQLTFNVQRPICSSCLIAHSAQTKD